MKITTLLEVMKPDFTQMKIDRAEANAMFFSSFLTQLSKLVTHKDYIHFNDVTFRINDSGTQVEAMLFNGSYHEVVHTIKIEEITYT